MCVQFLIIYILDSLKMSPEFTPISLIFMLFLHEQLLQTPLKRPESKVNYRLVSVFTAKAWLQASNPKQLRVIPSQQRYQLKLWQRLIWNILVTMFSCCRNIQLDLWASSCCYSPCLLTDLKDQWEVMSTGVAAFCLGLYCKVAVCVSFNHHRV